MAYVSKTYIEMITIASYHRAMTLHVLLVVVHQKLIAILRMPLKLVTFGEGVLEHSIAG